MFGLTMEKLVVIAVVAAIVVGPHRLPQYAAKLAEIVRALRTLVEQGKARAEEESGVAFVRNEWTSLDPRQYDPRRIVREALAEPQDTAHTRVDPAATEHAGRPDPDTTPVEPFSAEAVHPVSSQQPNPGKAASTPEVAAPAEIRGHYVMGGTSGHPRRIWVPEPESEAIATPVGAAASDAETLSASSTPFVG
ncbi:MAG: hypothetical protein ACTJHU_05190 [Mycetocola sp.]